MAKQTKYDFSGITIKYKLWLESGSGKSIMGGGRYELLKAIARAGSLSSAAKEIGISYRKAWDILGKSEKSLGFLLIDKQRGGEHGGRTILTKEGKKLLDAYEDLQKDFEKETENVFKKFIKKLR